MGAFDQSELELRQDILVYTSPVLTEDTRVTGPIEVELYIASDALDTDFTLRLLDVYPDGRAFNLDNTIQRVRYRNGYKNPVLMEKGEVYKITLGPLVTSNLFKRDHQLRVEIASSHFPRFARNLNTGGDNRAESKSVIARNTVHYSKTHPSHIVLPVIGEE